jgi:predicted nucleic acid-binding protein
MQPARDFFQRAIRKRSQASLCTSAEVLQELLHAYLPVQRMAALESAMKLVEGLVHDIWAIEPDDVRLARVLVGTHPALGARDLLHIACCKRRDVTQIQTFDRALQAAMPQPR